MPLIDRAVRNLLLAGCVRHVFISTPSALDISRTDASVVVGDLHTGLETALTTYPDARFALVHDVERAETPPEVIKSVVDELERGARAVIPVLPLTDTVKEVDPEGRIRGTRDREALRVLQSPLGVPVDVLRQSAGPLPAGLNVPLTTVAGHPHGRRIRTAVDLASVTP